ncbi:MAG: amino acid adenylation domain-containing protein, partial [Acidobacteriota bacterium]
MPNEIVEGYWLSPQQKRIWLLQSNNTAYRAQCAIDIVGELDQAVLVEALRRVILRHEILRTSFGCLPGMDVPIQVIDEKVTLSYQQIDLTEYPEIAQQHEIEKQICEQGELEFDFQHAPLVRFCLLIIAERHNILLVNMASLCGDSWTLKNLVNEICCCYQACLQDEELTDEPVQYVQFSEWQNQLLNGQDEMDGKEYWRKQSSLLIPDLILPLEEKHLDASLFRPDCLTFSVDPELSTKIAKIVCTENVSVMAFLLTCWQILLWRLTKQSQITTAILCHGREYQEMQQALGLYVRWPLLGYHFEDNLLFVEVLHEIDKSLRDTLEWQEYFCWEDCLALNSDNIDKPYSLIAFEYEEWLRKLYGGGVQFSIRWQYCCTERFKLKLSAVSVDDELRLEFHYDPSYYSVSVIELLSGEYQTLIRNAIAHPGSLVSCLDILAKSEREQLLSWNQTHTHYYKTPLWHQLFTLQATYTPESLAVVFKDEALSYRELNIRANQLAHYLHEFGIGIGALVAICMERGIDMIVALLGTLKAGASYIPFDTGQPKKRLYHMLNDAGVDLVLTQQHLYKHLSESQMHLLCLDSEWDKIARCSDIDANYLVNEQELAYVIYTSGSTGRPKGVMIAHYSVLNLVKVLEQAVYGKRAGGIRISVNAPLAFDASVKQLVQLVNGHSLYIIPEEVRRDGSQLLDYIRQHQLEVFDCTPSQLKLLLESGLLQEEGLRLSKVLVGGEAIDKILWQQLAENKKIAFYNMYGPTESTVDAAVCRIEMGKEVAVIGQAVTNTQLYIVDQQMQLVPLGVIGELHIGGEGLAQGYLNRPDLTAERFIPNIFSCELGARLYRTGDLARYLLDGNVEFLGRIDHQVKLRGFRIELGEIETVLQEHPEVRQAVVMVHQGTTEELRLVAYLVANHNCTSLREYLRERLPEYMIPARFVILECMPLTRNGKIDREALLELEQLSEEEEEIAKAQTPYEEIVAGIWSEVIGIKSIGREDNFFNIGGHSLIATQMISRVREAFGVEITLRNLFDAPTVAGLAEKIVAAQKAEQGLVMTAITRVPRDRGLSLSFAQQRIWFLDQLEPGSYFYNLPKVMRVKGILNILALQKSINEIVRRHEVFRTRFGMEDGQPVQLISELSAIVVPVIDLSDMAESEREKAAHQLVNEEVKCPFDLAQGPLVRALVIKLVQQEHIVLFIMHHIVSDGWSMAILVRELTVLYEVYNNGQSSPLPELPIQYADFAHWQQEWLQGEVLDKQLSYWKEQLGNQPTVLPLPTDYLRPAIETYRGSCKALMLSKELTEALQVLSRGQEVTLFMTLLAGYQALLYRYSNQESISVGTPIANRNRAEIEGLIGFFVNTLVLRTDVKADESFVELLERVRESCLAAYAHQDISFEKLVEELQPARDMSHSPLFQVMMILQNAPVSKIELTNLSLAPVEFDSQTAKFDLTLSMVETEIGLYGALEYNTDLFNASTIERMIGHYENLLQSIVSNPQQSISSLALLSEAERHQLLYQWNDTDVQYRTDRCIHELFEEQVERSPESVAVVFEDQMLSYRELNNRANQLAHYLRTMGIKPDQLVGLCMERSIEMVVAILGILKAGGAYLPLDPIYPAQRIAFMLTDADISVLLIQHRFFEQLPQHSINIICLDTEWSKVACYDNTNPIITLKAEHLAYAIYTSGSTGTPKCALNTHQGIRNRLLWMQDAYQLLETDVVLQKTPYTFDVSVWEFLWPLMVGARLVVARPGGHQDSDYLSQLISQQRITTLHFVPSMLQVFLTTQNLHECNSLKRVICSGETLPIGLQTEFYTHIKVPLVNLYGPTEAAIDVTYWNCNVENGRYSVPIGRPIANTQIYLLDQQLQPVPIGVAGELHIGGVGLARGYLNRPELTAEKFIPNPFSEEVGARLYKTGDLARYRVDGNIDFLGRIDDQVKIRGLRIELGEIETVMAQYPGITENVVVVRSDSNGDKQLVAYLVANSKDALVVSDLHSFLKERLPEYMIPSTFVELASLPLTPNGKLDRNKLPTPSQMRSTAGLLVYPRDAWELQLVHIWEEILNIRPIGIRDNFFSLGGHSLLAVRLIAK